MSVAEQDGVELLNAEGSLPALPTRRSPTLPLLLALPLAIAGGLLARRLGARGADTAAILAQLGQLWLNALRMPLVPLVFCLITTGTATLARTAAAGRLARITLGVFLLLLTLGSVLGVAIMLALTHLWPVALLHAGPQTTSVGAPPSLLAEFVALVPVNPIAAAAEGALAPLIVFAIALGAAATRIPAAAQSLLLDTLNALTGALLILIQWVLRVAPFGIFCLLFATIATVGTQGARGLLQYAVLTSITPAAGILIAQLIGIFAVRGFSRAVLPAQTLAATTQSSSACLPALLEAARALGLPPEIIAAIMPLAVTTFRFGNVFGAVATGLVGANLFGIHPGFLQIATAVGLGVLTNIASVGVPGAAVLLAAWGPVFLALGAPLEALTLYIAIITVPDILLTIANVTGDLAATSLIARLTGSQPA